MTTRRRLRHDDRELHPRLVTARRTRWTTLALALLNRTNLSIKDLIGSGQEAEAVRRGAAGQGRPLRSGRRGRVSLQLAQLMLPELE